MHIRIATSLDRDDVRDVHLAAFAEGEREIVSKLAINLLSEETTPQTISLVAETEGAVVRFKAPLVGSTIIRDVIKGNIEFQNSELDDFIIARSDGSPTYNFVVVVDDITMGINTIIRGDDHVMNTPKQILLYRALGSPLPT
ncbi:MAG: hypothetical protein KAR17_07615, partial [Cyclobacteriaceae bacterium]|nr:hypothetical protein [Cyclobacteriaceae bacterium]